MIVQGDITIGGKAYTQGSYIPPWKVYPFFLVHMGIFGYLGFYWAYFKEAPPGLLYMHGGFAAFVYLVFYKAIFGIDEVKWILINALLGVFGLYSEIGILLSWSGKNIDSFPLHVHVIPFMYYVLYTFLLRQVIIEVTNSGTDKTKREKVSYVYLVVSLALYVFLHISSNA
jgi:hypothetical protein